MALSPPLAHRAGYVMSETLTTFLASLFVFLLARIDNNRRNMGTCASAGITSVLLVLTAPGTVFVAFTATMAIIVMTMRTPVKTLAICAGALVVITPWQLHCLRARGRIVPTIYTMSDYATRSSSVFAWARTWSRNSYDSVKLQIYFWHNDIDAFDSLPDYAFDNETERTHLRQVCLQRATGDLSAEEFDNAFGAIVTSRKTRQPGKYYLLLPLLRSAHVWCSLDSDGVGWTQVPGGPFQVSNIGTLYCKRGIFSTFLLVMHLTTLTAIAVGCYKTVTSRHLCAWALLLGVLCYTVAGGYSTGHEVRRNVVFYPVLFVLLGISSSRLRSEKLGKAEQLAECSSDDNSHDCGVGSPKFSVSSLQRGFERTHCTHGLFRPASRVVTFLSKHYASITQRYC